MQYYLLATEYVDSTTVYGSLSGTSLSKDGSAHRPELKFEAFLPSGRWKPGHCR